MGHDYSDRAEERRQYEALKRRHQHMIKLISANDPRTLSDQSERFKDLFKELLDECHLPRHVFWRVEDLKRQFELYDIDSNLYKEIDNEALRSEEKG